MELTKENKELIKTLKELKEIAKPHLGQKIVMFQIEEHLKKNKIEWQ